MKLYLSYLVVTMLNCNLVVLFATFFVIFMTFFFFRSRQFTVLCHCALEHHATKRRCTFCCSIWQPSFYNSSRNPFPQACVQTSISLIHPSWSNTEGLGQKKSLWRHFNCLTKSINCSFPEECKDVTRVQILLINIPEVTSPSDSAENSCLSDMTKVRWIQHLL